MSNLGFPGGSAIATAKRIPGQGAFAIPSGVQRIAEQALYSTYRFAAGTSISGTIARFFTVQLGGQGQGFTSNDLSESETNQQIANQAPGDETYEVSALACELFGVAGATPAFSALPGDIRMFHRIGVFVWKFGSVNIQVAPLSMVGAGGGVFGANADSGSPVTMANNGNGGIWMYQNLVISVPSTQRFSLELRMGTAGSGVAIAPTAETHVRVSLFNMSRSIVPIA